MQYTEPRGVSPIKGSFILFLSETCLPARTHSKQEQNYTMLLTISSEGLSACYDSVDSSKHFFGTISD
jgi:hypothetical protein